MRGRGWNEGVDRNLPVTPDLWSSSRSAASPRPPGPAPSGCGAGMHRALGAAQCAGGPGEHGECLMTPTFAPHWAQTLSLQ